MPLVRWLVLPAEMPAVLALLDGAMELRSVRGSRSVPAAAFFVGPMESVTAPDELAAHGVDPARGRTVVGVAGTITTVGSAETSAIGVKSSRAR